jgi:5'-3' exonuclease
VIVVMRYRLPGVPGPLLVADAPHLLYRAFYALPDTITNDEGMPVNALLGSANQVLWCIEKYSPRAVVFCFGAEAAKYRVEAYPDYHAQRPPVPDKLEPQWERSGEFYRAFGWSVMHHEDLEADDLLHSLSIAETAARGHTLILTGDRDMLQCVDDSVTVLLQRARQQGPDEMDADAVREMYGVDPEQVPDFIALRGDPSDGLPGAKGIGAKTAAELLRRKGNLEHAILGAIREKPAIRRALVEQADELRAFKDIATLRTVELEPPPDAPTDYAGGAEAARGLGMNRLAERLKDLA